jgi:hypothetical protein
MKPEFAFDVCHGVFTAAREALDGKFGTTNLESRDKYLWRPDLRPHLAEYVADFTLAGRHALAAPIFASRLALFRVFYVGGAAYPAARAHLGVSERTWSQWADEVRARVGRELLRRGMFPPRDYFRTSAEPPRPAAQRSSL